MKRRSSPKRTQPFAPALAVLLTLAGASSAAAGGFPLPKDFKPEPALEGYAIQTWTRGQGLASTTIIDLAQTRDGYLWLGTTSGLARFDGKRFELFNRSNIPGLRSSRVESLMASDSGDLWVGFAQDALFRWSDRRWSRFSADEGLVAGHVRDIFETAEGEIWVNDNGTILRLRGDRFEPIDFSDPSCPTMKVENLAFGPDQDLWLWSASHLVRQSAGRCVETIENPSMIAADTSPIPQRFLTATRDGSVWLGGPDEVAKLSATRPRTVERRWPGVSTDAFMEDSAGNLWVGTNSGLMRYHDGEARSLTEHDGLTDNRVWALLEDRDGSIWLGTYDGLQRLRQGRIRPISLKEGLRSEFVWAVYRLADGSVLVGHRDGADHYRDGAFEPIPFSDPQRKSPVRNFFQDSRGRIWAGARSGAHHLIDGELRPWLKAPKEVADQIVNHFYESRDGHLWLATRLGVFELSSDGQLLTSLLSRRWVIAVHQDRQGNMWLGADDGLYRWNHQILEDFKAHPETRAWIRSIHEDDQGNLWLGTVGHGLVRFDGRGFARFDTGNGLPDDNVWRVFDDHQGRFWMCSDLGIFAVSKEQLHRAARDGSKIESRHFGLADGLLDPECNGGHYPSAFRDEQNRLWFPTAGGIAVVTTGKPENRPLSFPPIIESIRLDEQDHPVGPPLSVPYDARSLEVHITVPALIDADRVVLRYRMRGLDPEWRRASESRTAVYGRIPPGAYRFEVQAIGADGGRSRTTPGFDVEVGYPPWRSAWAYGLYLLVALTTTVAFVRSQTRRVERERAMVEKQTKILQGFLPICAQCKSIREHDGSWSALEAYIDSHSEAQFSHGICPTCAKKSFPNIEV